MDLHIDGWKQHLCFSSAHFIPNHHKCGILHGHTYVISCTIQGTPDSSTHMIIDFSTLKNILHQLIEPLDHHILIPESHPMITKSTTEITIKNNNKTYQLPIEDCILLPIPSTTVEHLTEYILKKLSEQLTSNKNIKKISLQIDEGLGQSATVEHNL
jgi:6-pyruvoyltetrahydropterin/6-carboxytetrahydropterin synthase